MRFWAKRIVGGAAVVAMIAFAVIETPRWLRREKAVEQADAAATLGPAKPLVSLAADAPQALVMPDDVVQQLRLRTVPVQASPPPDLLTLTGTLTLDASRYTAVRSRFPGEVTEIPVNSRTGRPAGVGEAVQTGDLLAVLWSRELGEKKSDLVESLSSLRLDTTTLERLQELYTKGEIPERSLREAERAVEADRIAVDRDTRTLLAWRVPEAEIEAVRQEAANIEHGQPTASGELVPQWARVEIRAPFPGVVLERNLSQGEMVEPSDELYKIGDLSRLRVVAYAYEEDLPRLDALPPASRRWDIDIPAEPAAPPAQGEFDQVGDIIDPAQHTALVMGWVDNPGRSLRVGQFIRAQITLPPPAGELVIPSAALVERGLDKIVFVQLDAAHHVYQMRQVALGRRIGDVVTIHAGGADGVHPQDQVVMVGAVELLAALNDLEAARLSETAKPPSESTTRSP